MENIEYIELLNANKLDIILKDGSSFEVDLMPGEYLRFLAFKKAKLGKFYIFEFDNLSRVNLSAIRAYRPSILVKIDFNS